MRVYSLKTCDTCKKALKWLDENGIAHANHDVRADGLSADIVSALIDQVGWEALVNRRSTTWRNLDEVAKDGLDAQKATALIVDNPTLMKRPVFVTEQEVMVGWNDTVRQWLAG